MSPDGTRTRVILISGPGGSGTSTLAASTIDALMADGLRPRLIDVADMVPAHPAVVAELGATLGRVLTDVGAGAVPADMWESLPGIAHLSALHSMLDALAAPEVDVVVVDCGPLEQARTLVALPATLGRLLDAALTPRLAMWRTPGEPEGPTTVFEEVSSIRSIVRAMEGALGHDATAVWLVTTTDPRHVDRILAASTVLPVLGVGVEGVAVTDLPLGDDSSVDAPDTDAHLNRLRDELALAPVPGLRDEALIVSAQDLTFTLDIPIPGAWSTRAVVGRRDTELVIDVDGARRWLPLPPVLLRCRATHAERTPTGLRVNFELDDDLWPRQSKAAS